MAPVYLKVPRSRARLQKPPPGSLRNVLMRVVEHVSGRSVTSACSIEDVRILAQQDIADLPDMIDNYERVADLNEENESLREDVTLWERKFADLTNRLMPHPQILLDHYKEFSDDASKEAERALRNELLGILLRLKDPTESELDRMADHERRLIELGDLWRKTVVEKYGYARGARGPYLPDAVDRREGVKKDE